MEYYAHASFKLITFSALSRACNDAAMAEAGSSALLRLAFGISTEADLRETNIGTMLSLCSHIYLGMLHRIYLAFECCNESRSFSTCGIEVVLSAGGFSSLSTVISLLSLLFNSNLLIFPARANIFN